MPSAQQSRGRAQRRVNAAQKDWRHRDIGRDWRDAFHRTVEVTVEDEFTAVIGGRKDDPDQVFVEFKSDADIVDALRYPGVQFLVIYGPDGVAHTIGKE